jgi:hypothetical protein
MDYEGNVMETNMDTASNHHYEIVQVSIVLIFYRDFAKSYISLLKKSTEKRKQSSFSMLSP